MSPALRPSAFRLVVLVAALFVARHARADDAYYRVAVSDLKLTAGELPAARPGDAQHVDWTRAYAMQPWAAVDGGGEAYIEHAEGGWAAASYVRGTGSLHVVVRGEAGKDVTGTLVVPAGDWKKMVPVKFAIPAAAASADAKTAFNQAKLVHYNALLSRPRPGAAWFRHQADAARVAVGDKAAGPDAGRFVPPPDADSIDDTYDLFAGGRAVSENLQLDRVLPAGRLGEEPTVQVDSIPGVKTKEMDWAPLTKGMKPEADPLAAVVPVDQHVVFFPSFTAMTALVDEVDAQGVPALQAMEPRSEDAGTKDRYQRQLGLSMTGLGRVVGPQLIKSVAVTGSDPYLRVGSDVAVLFEAKDADALLNALAAQRAMKRFGGPAVETTTGKAGAVSYTRVLAADGSVRSFTARLPDSDVVVVTNSLFQLERLAAVKAETVKSIATAPEYTYFRDRYKRGDADEQALVILTDATIRRWCSPRWRILDSRRTLAAAVMADLQAEHARAIVAGRADAAVRLTPKQQVPGMGAVGIERGRIVSAGYGTLDFMTPIAEIPLDKVTTEELALYGRWRNTYEQNWRNFFDPIALRVGSANGRMTADLTVLPLIGGSEYRTFVDLTNGVAIPPGGGDPHGAILHLAMALNRDSAPMKELRGFVGQNVANLKIDPFAWVGRVLAVYVDDDPFWQEAAKAQDPDQFLQENLHRLPVAVYVANEGPLKLAAFMATVRSYVDGSAPGSTVWETLEHNGAPYVRVAGTGAADRTKVYYATTPEALVVTVNEDVLKRALDRQAARRAAAKAGGGAATTGPATVPATVPATNPAGAPSHEWLGQSLAFQADARALAVVGGLFGRTYREKMQELAWSNLPALNEWKRLFPDQDPVKVHERLWQTRLIDPAGGTYAWNEQYQTMESTTYGHPGQPKDGPAIPPQLVGVKRVGLGVTFENQGLRAKAVLEREWK
ncbi:MAG TPA: hypothetical protein VF796_00660 [Humisphaera sp.]